MQSYKQTKAQILSGCSKPVVGSKVIDNNTLDIIYEDGDRAIRFHDTDIITWPKYKENMGIRFVLNSGGFHTSTTKGRMNQYTPNDYRFYQENGLWYVCTSEGIFDYFDGMEFIAGKPTKDFCHDVSRVKIMKKKISKYCSLITKDNLPRPDSGDCWYCALQDKEGKAMGDLFNNTAHLINHMEEEYLPGTLLVNAMKENGWVNNKIGVHYQMKVLFSFKAAVRRYMTKRLLPNVVAK